MKPCGQGSIPPSLRGPASWFACVDKPLRHISESSPLGTSLHDPRRAFAVAWRARPFSPRSWRSGIAGAHRHRPSLVREQRARPHLTAGQSTSYAFRSAPANALACSGASSRVSCSGLTLRPSKLLIMGSWVRVPPRSPNTPDKSVACSRHRIGCAIPTYHVRLMVEKPTGRERVQRAPAALRVGRGLGPSRVARCPPHHLPFVIVPTCRPI